MNIVQLKKLSYDEVAKCNKCGFCLPSCPTYLVKKKESYSARGRNAITRFAIENKLQLNEDTERSIFTCLGCGAICPCAPEPIFLALRGLASDVGRRTECSGRASRGAVNAW